MKNINKINYQRIMIYIFLIIAIPFILFLFTRMFIFYKKYKEDSQSNLVYSFNANTSSYEKNNEILADISEQFISYGISYGIDVSEWQGKINWEKVAKTGIKFAIIRCGFREIIGSNIKEDANFKYNIEEAQKFGLRVGVYFFGTAKNKEEALEEANFTYNLIKDYNLTYPVVYDIESIHTGRLKYIDSSTITDNILTFTETLSSFGYETMIYSNKKIFENSLYTGRLDGKLIWLAHYVDKTDYKGNYNMWQYSDTGRVDGIATNVDLNISYFEYVNDENKIINNPNYKPIFKINFNEVNEKVKTIDNTIYRNSPTNEMPNKLGSLNKNTELIRTGISNQYSRLLYNGKTIFIENKYLEI